MRKTKLKHATFGVVIAVVLAIVVLSLIRTNTGDDHVHDAHQHGAGVSTVKTVVM
jgi:hypothetical protein